MLDPSIEIQLCSLIMKIIEGERSVEYLRNRMCDYTDFNPYVVFESLSYRNSGALIPRDFKDFLGDRNTQWSNDDFYLLVRQYSSGLNGRLTIEDFFQLVLPSTNQLNREIVLGRRFFNRQTASYDISLRLLFEKELSMQKDLENLKAELYRQSGFSIRKAFLSLDKEEKGYIREQDIVAFMRRFGHYLSDSDLDSFLRRVDTQDDGIITFEEFLDVLLPLHTSSSGNSFQSSGLGNSAYSGKFSSENTKKEEPKQEEIQEPTDDKDKNSENKEEKTLDEDKRLELEENELDKLEEEKEDLLSPEDGIISPKFKDEKEFTMGDLQDFETPEKAAETNTRETVPKKLYSNISIESEISKFLALQLISERKLEHCRQNLAMMKEFSISKFFELIDKNGQGELFIADLEEFLKELELEPCNEDFWILFKRFGNKDIAMKITLEGLKHIVNPKDEDYQFMTEDKEDWSFGEITLKRVLELFTAIFETERKIEDRRHDIESISDVDVKAQFEAVDIDEDGEINDEDLKIALERSGIQTTEKDRKLLMIRYTKSSERNIGFEDFSKEIIPVIPSDEDAY